MKKLIQYLVIIGLIVILFIREISRPGPEPPSSTTIQTTVVPGDSSFREVKGKTNLQESKIDSTLVPKPTIPKPVISYIMDGSGQTIIDTNAIKSRYQNIINQKDSILAVLRVKRTYSDTIPSDSITEVEAIINFSVQDNRLFDHCYLFKNNRVKSITTTINNPIPINKLFIGGGVNFLPNSPGISADLLFVHKKNMAFNGGYDFTNQMITAKGFYLIKFKK